MSVSHAHFYLFRIIFTFQCSSPAVPDIITRDSERLYKLFGGAGTIKSLNKMTKESKENLYLFLKNLPIYEEIRTKYGETVVTHSGFSANYTNRKNNNYR